ncbi:MAG: hypothetical protein H5T41_00830 [Methanomassiliicoccales archaeon]|nr:hypothetical protein [Methanomassiliicoccales archaeon]
MNQLPCSRPCGLDCTWCVYNKIKEIEGYGYPGCSEKESCAIRDCCRREGVSCEECTSFPCINFINGFECMRAYEWY